MLKIRSLCFFIQFVILLFLSSCNTCIRMCVSTRPATGGLQITLRRRKWCVWGPEMRRRLGISTGGNASLKLTCSPRHDEAIVAYCVSREKRALPTRGETVRGTAKRFDFSRALSRARDGYGQIRTRYVSATLAQFFARRRERLRFRVCVFEIENALAFSSSWEI